MVLVGCDFLGLAWILHSIFDLGPVPIWLYAFVFCFIAWNDSPPALRRQQQRHAHAVA
jgi:hypothetical protein